MILVVVAQVMSVIVMVHYELVMIVAVMPLVVAMLQLVDVHLLHTSFEATVANHAQREDEQERGCGETSWKYVVLAHLGNDTCKLVGGCWIRKLDYLFQKYVIIYLFFFFYLQSYNLPLMTRYFMVYIA